MSQSLDSIDTRTVTNDGTSHRQLSTMLGAGRSFSGNERNCCFLNIGNGRFADFSGGSGLDIPDDGRAIGATGSMIMHPEVLRAARAQEASLQLEDAIGRVHAGNYAEAAIHYQESLRLRPNHALAHVGYADLLVSRGNAAAAVIHYRESLRLNPDIRAAANNLAWLLATHPNQEVRDPSEALRVARGLAAAGGNQIASVLDTLAAAEAGAGDFKAAAETALRAISLAKAAGDTALAAGLASRLALYKSSKPFIDASLQSQR